MQPCRNLTIHLAGRRVVQLNFGRPNDPVLAIMRRVLRDSRAVLKVAKSAGGPGAEPKPINRRPPISPDIVRIYLLRWLGHRPAALFYEIDKSRNT